MKRLLLFAVAAVVAGSASLLAAETEEEGPTALVESLYAASDDENPFFSDHRKTLRAYFTAALADLIRKDREASQGEVGVIDGDPRYDAQDTDITALRVARAKISDDSATVLVTFENFGEKKRFTYRLETNDDGEWRVDDVEWSRSRTLRTALEDAYSE